MHFTARLTALASAAFALASATVSPHAAAQNAAAPICSAPLKPALQIDLYFGRGEVSDAEWESFLADVVTPRFPDGLSAIEVKGQFREPSGRIVAERAKLLVVVVFDAPAHQPRVEETVAAYKQRFHQHAVLQVERPVCAGL